MKIVETWMISVPEDFQSISMATVLANWMGIISHSKTPAERTWAKYIKKLWDTPNSVSMVIQKMAGKLICVAKSRKYNSDFGKKCESRSRGKKI
jgi:hypothetical protein